MCIRDSFGQFHIVHHECKKGLGGDRKVRNGEKRCQARMAPLFCASPLSFPRETVSDLLSYSLRRRDRVPPMRLRVSIQQPDRSIIAKRWLAHKPPVSIDIYACSHNWAHSLKALPHLAG